MSGNVFIDTNIFVYANLKANGNLAKNEKAKEFFNGISASSKVFISTQVLNEFYSVLLKNSIQDDIIQKICNAIIKECTVLPVTFETVQKAWLLNRCYAIDDANNDEKND